MNNEEKREESGQKIFQEKIDENMSRLMIDVEEDEMLDPLPEEDYETDEWDDLEDEEYDSEEDISDEYAPDEYDEYEDEYEEYEYEEEEQPQLKVEYIQPDSKHRGKKAQNTNKKKKHSAKAKAAAKKSAKPVKPVKSAKPGKITYVSFTDEEMEPVVLPRKLKKKHKALKVTGMVAAMVVVAAGSAYGAVTYYYTDKFFYGTTINGINTSHMTAYEAEQAIADVVEDYSIEIAARNQEPETIDGKDINYSYVSDGEVLSLLKKQKPYEWVKGYFQSVNYTTAKNITYDKQLLQGQVKALECAQEENQVEPENAYVAFEGSEFTIIPETEGSELVVKEAYKALDAAISGSETEIDFDTAENVYATADITSDSQALAETRDAYNNYTRASITYTIGNDQVVLDGATLKDWLQFDDKGQLVQDDASLQQHIAEFVAQLAATYDTVGTTRSFTSTNGRQVSVYGSAYGWKIDQAAEVAQLTQEIASGVETVREPIYAMTANSRGANDLGDTYIEVDMGVQHMYYYQNGSIIFDSDFVSGSMTADRMTPEGIFVLYNKRSPDVLRGSQRPDGSFEYETPVSYWMPFNGGVGFHDATWQPYFGGDRYLSGGSHGCINLPLDSAATLYSIIQYNVPIICFY